MDALSGDQHAEGEEEEEGFEDGGEEDGGEEDEGKEEEGKEEEGKEEEGEESVGVDDRVVEMEGEGEEIPASQPQDSLLDSPPPQMLPDSQPLFEEDEVPLDSQPPLEDNDTDSNDCCSKILPHGQLTCLTADFLEKKDWCQNCLKRSEAAPQSPEQREVINVEETPEKALSLEEKNKMIKSLERKLSAATLELANNRKENTAQILFSI